MEFKRGMTVGVLGKYGSQFAGRTGVVALPPYGTYSSVAVWIDGEANPNSNYGYYYFAQDELYSFKSAKELINVFAIKNVYFNDPVTVVMWEDGTKTIVRCGKNDIYDPEKGLAMAVTKKAFGNKGKYYDEFKKWLPMQGAKNASPKISTRMPVSIGKDNEFICCDVCKYKSIDTRLEPCRSCLSSKEYCPEFVHRDF